MDEPQTAIPELQNSNPDIRELALDKIGTLKPDNAFEIIVPFLSDLEPEVRSTAAGNLGEIGESRSMLHLIGLAKNDSVEEVRSEALSALANYRSPEILKCLIDEVERVKKSRRPRQIVAQQLQHYNNEKSVDALSFLMYDDDVYVRIFAADSLLELNRPRLQKVWEQALEDESTYVIEIANKALASLRNYDELLETG